MYLMAFDDSDYPAVAAMAQGVLVTKSEVSTKHSLLSHLARIDF